MSVLVQAYTVHSKPAGDKPHVGSNSTSGSGAKGSNFQGCDFREKIERW
jgi:hypothetical protein